jgi:5-methylcytosine-specific restriction endonuclease McrA
MNGMLREICGNSKTKYLSGEYLVIKHLTNRIPPTSKIGLSGLA